MEKVYRVIDIQQLEVCPTTIGVNVFVSKRKTRVPTLSSSVEAFTSLLEGFNEISYQGVEPTLHNHRAKWHD